MARAAIDTGGFRFAKLRSIGDVNFLPGGAKYGDLPGMLALGAPQRCGWPAKGPNAPALVQAAYVAAKAQKDVQLFSGPQQEKVAAAIEWLGRP